MKCNANCYANVTQIVKLCTILSGVRRGLSRCPVCPHICIPPTPCPIVGSVPRLSQPEGACVK